MVEVKESIGDIEVIVALQSVKMVEAVELCTNCLSCGRCRGCDVRGIVGIYNVRELEMGTVSQLFLVRNFCEVRLFCPHHE